ncbi:MAG: STAS domain-containing protein [Candidatus Muiribacteriota bacterium]
MLDIIKENLNDNIIYIELAGKLIYDKEEEVNLTFEEVLTQNKHLLLDLSKLNYVNSSGLGIFINLLKNMRKLNKKFIIINPAEEVKMLFDITSLDKMFEIVKTKEEAKDLVL